MVLVVFEDQVDDAGERDLALGDAPIANLVILRGRLPALPRQLKSGRVLGTRSKRSASNCLNSAARVAEPRGNQRGSAAPTCA
jgi:hypothetical protein